MKSAGATVTAANGAGALTRFRSTLVSAAFLDQIRLTRPYVDMSLCEVHTIFYACRKFWSHALILRTTTGLGIHCIPEIKLDTGLLSSRKVFFTRNLPPNSRFDPDLLQLYCNSALSDEAESFVRRSVLD